MDEFRRGQNARRIELENAKSANPSYWPKGRSGDNSQLEIGNWSSFDTTIVKLLLKVLLAPISFAAMLAAAVCSASMRSGTN